MVLKAALIALLVAVATGWVAYDQSDPAVCLVALTVAFTAWLTSTTLMVLGLVSEAEAEAEAEEEVTPTDRAPSAAPVLWRWNGTGSPRLVDSSLSGREFRRCYFPNDEEIERC